MTSIDTSTIPIYSDLYKAFGTLRTIIKENANINYQYDNNIIKDLTNSHKIYNKSLEYLLPTFDGTIDSNKNYSETDNLTIPAANTSTLLVGNTLFDNNIFKNNLRNCFKLIIEQSKYDSTLKKVLNDKLTSLTKKQHLLYYGKINSDKLTFDPDIVLNIQYTIFLLDIYINIIDAFLLIDFKADHEKKEAFWNEPKIKVESDKYDTDYPDLKTDLGINFSDLDTMYNNEKKIKDYEDIHIVNKPLLSNDVSIYRSNGIFIIKDAKNSNKYKYAESGIYLYIGNNYDEQTISGTIYKYFDTIHQKPVETDLTTNHAASKANTTYVFSDNKGLLQNGIYETAAKYTYGYEEFSFKNNTKTQSSPYSDSKKPYQKLIRIFLYMLRNIHYKRLETTLQNLKNFFENIKKLLLTSIYSINIYHNLAYSLDNLLLLNYPNYNTSTDTSTDLDKFIKYISDGATNKGIISTDASKIQIASVVDNNYKAFFLNIEKSSSSNFKNILDKYITNAYVNIDKSSTPFANKGKYSYVANSDLLIYDNFDYDPVNKRIKVFGTFQSTKNARSKLVENTTETKKNYSILIPNYNILLGIKDIDIADTTKPEIILDDNDNIDVLKNSGVPYSNNFRHADTPIYLYENSIYELENKNNKLADSITAIDKNINSNKTKILNNASLYEASKSKNTILYYEYIMYIIIVAFIFAILFIINIAKLDIPLMKMISLICFGTTILILVIYYIINILYIKESYIETFTTNSNVYSTTICNNNCINPTAIQTNTQTLENATDITTKKNNHVNNKLIEKARDIINSIMLRYYYTDSQTLFNKEIDLNSLISNKYNTKNYVNYFLENKTGDAHLNTDMLKYENANYDIYIFSTILLAIIIVGSYTINLFTNNKYLGIFFLISIILIICLFTYFIINSNKIVRTISSNYYWGREFEKTYENFEDYEEDDNTSEQSSIQPAQPGMQQTPPVMQPAMQLAMQPAMQVGMQPALQGGMQPALQGGMQPALQPALQPAMQSAMQSGMQPAMQSGIQPGMQPALQGGMQPAMQSGIQPGMQSAMQSGMQPAMQPAMQSGIQPGMQQGGMLQGMQNTIQSAMQPAMQPAMQSGMQLEMQLGMLPGMQQGLQPGMQPAMQPGMQQAMQPGMQQAMQPVI